MLQPLQTALGGGAQLNPYASPRYAQPRRVKPKAPPLPSAAQCHEPPSKTSADSCTREMHLRPPVHQAPRCTGKELIRLSLGACTSQWWEEEKYRKARAKVKLKGAELEGLIAEGFSIGGMETFIVLPTFNSVFNIGWCPSRAINQDFLFIKHAHLDHIGSLPMYLATHSLNNLKPPTFVPPVYQGGCGETFGNSLYNERCGA